ncbi:MAG: M23 family metallopeptidase [Cyclobacteriaceae bacterium]|nr:MAG: M23 family metallopeptidase [Cyclobacteriaceae bacterium]
MRQLKYRYNPTTCRYEPVPLRTRNILGATLLYLCLTGGLFVGLLFLHSSLFTTETEKALAQENKVLKVHHKELTRELNTVQASLFQLQQADEVVFEKLASNLNHPGLLENFTFKPSQQETTNFKKQYKETQAESADLLKKARYTNFILASNLTVDKEGLALLTNIPSLQPIANKELTRLASGFGERMHPFHGANYLHPGIDFVAPRGTSVVASTSGKISQVLYSDLQMGKGNFIEIDHGNGYTTRYHHLDEIRIKQGQSVTKGSEIGTVGMTGGAVSPHLHFEVLKDGKHVNPIDYLFEGLTSNEYAALKELAKQKNQALD